MSLNQNEKKGLFRSRKRTIIIVVSVAIILFVTSYFLTGFGRLEHPRAYGLEPMRPTRVFIGSYWLIEVKLKNMAGESVTFVRATVDGTEVDNYASHYVAGQTSTNMSQGQVIRKGEMITIRFYLDPDLYYTSKRGHFFEWNYNVTWGMDKRGVAFS